MYVHTYSTLTTYQLHIFFPVFRGKKWPFSALRENFCSRITFSRRAGRKVLFVPHSEPRISPQTSKFPRAKPSAISRFSGKTSFLNSGTKFLKQFFFETNPKLCVCGVFWKLREKSGGRCLNCSEFRNTVCTLYLFQSWFFWIIM